MDITRFVVSLILSVMVYTAEGLNMSETARPGTLVMNNTGRENCSLTRVTPRGALDYFRVNEEQNLVLAKPLDLEVIYTFYKVKDGINVEVNCIGNNPKQKSIFVIPENEFDPEFVNKPYEVFIQEDISPGTTVFCFFCTKQTVIDGDQIQYGHVTNFTFIPHEIQGLDGAHKFSIDPTLGNITTNDTFDYESRNKQFYLKVQASDDGGRTGDASILVSVNDVDDNPPKFTRPGCEDVTCVVTKYSADIDIFTQGQVTQVTPSAVYAKDIDAGVNNKIEYVMVPVGEDVHNLTSNIWINNSTGQLYVEEPFDNITNIVHSLPIALMFDITATEVSSKAYSTNTTLMLNIYRSLTTPVPTSTSERPETTEDPTTRRVEDTDNTLAILLVEIIVPSVIVIVVIIVVVWVVIRRKRQAKERSQYEVKDGARVYKNVIGDRDMAVEPRSSLVISPYELVTLYDNSNHYARFESTDDDQHSDECQGQSEGQGSEHDEVHDNKAMDEGGDNLYARVEKKKLKSAKNTAQDVFSSENPGDDLRNHGNIGDGDLSEGDNESVSKKDVKNLEY